MKKLLSLAMLSLLIGFAWGQSTVFSETMGSGGSSGASIASWESSNYFDNNGLTFAGTGDMRNTNVSSGYTGVSGTWNVMLNAASEYLLISDINTTAYTNLSLSFGIRKGATAENGSTFSVQVSSDGSSWTSLTMPALPTGTGTATWYYRTCTGTIPATGNLRVKFTSTSTTEFRIDDVLLTGTAQTPSIIVSPSSISGFTYVHGYGPSNPSKTYTLSGTNLTPSSGTLTVTASTDYEISTDDESYSSPLNVSYSSSTLSSTTIYLHSPIFNPAVFWSAIDHVFLGCLAVACTAR